MSYDQWWWNYSMCKCSKHLEHMSNAEAEDTEVQSANVTM